ncbi:transposase for IS26 [Klebsiella pneumoniae]|nr:IS6 family transposase [Klebsiella pneumoniae]VGK32012.1 transposase for IS26 [Klebsiella pneumoniae]
MNPFKGRHFQRDIILWAVRWYCKYGISYRELQEMLAERGVNVDHSTIYRWVQRYAPEMEKRLRWYWRNPSDLCPWHMDETYVKVNGRWAYLYRAVDSRGHPVARSKSRPGRSLLIQLRVYKRRVRRNVQGQANSRY